MEGLRSELVHLRFNIGYLAKNTSEGVTTSLKAQDPRDVPHTGKLILNVLVEYYIGLT